MVESSGGYRESNPPSRDLMAQFDMAHDRADRSPEVRAYLENLRPQILELQKRLRLVTDEDIAGLEKRVEIDMREVDKLVGLIESFKKAWRENRISTSEARRMVEVRIEREAGAAWREIVETVDRNNSRAALQERWSAITAFAQAGEPGLAWNLYLDTVLRHPFPEIRTANDLLARVAIWRAFIFAGINSPFNADTIADALHGPNPFSSQVVEKVVAMLADGGRVNAAIGSADFISDHGQRTRALIRMRPHVPDYFLEEIDEQITNAARTSIPLQILAFFAKGDAGFAFRLAEHGGGVLTSSKIAEAVAEGIAVAGDPKQALEVLHNGPSNPTQRAQAMGRMAAALVDRGDVPSAMKFMKMYDYARQSMRPDDLSRIIVGLVAHGDSEAATRIAGTFADNIRRIRSEGLPQHHSAEEWELARAILPVVRAFADAGLPTTNLISALEDLHFYNPKLSGERYQNVLIEARTAVAIRTFKRVAKQFIESSGREAWDAVIADLVKSRTDIATQLTYDKPLPA